MGKNKTNEEKKKDREALKQTLYANLVFLLKNPNELANIGSVATDFAGGPSDIFKTGASLLQGLRFGINFMSNANIDGLLAFKKAGEKIAKAKAKGNILFKKTISESHLNSIGLSLNDLDKLRQGEYKIEDLDINYDVLKKLNIEVEDLPKVRVEPANLPLLMDILGDEQFWEIILDNIQDLNADQIADFFAKNDFIFKQLGLSDQQRPVFNQFIKAVINESKGLLNVREINAKNIAHIFQEYAAGNMENVQNAALAIASDPDVRKALVHLLSVLSAEQQQPLFRAMFQEPLSRNEGVLTFLDLNNERLDPKIRGELIEAFVLFLSETTVELIDFTSRTLETNMLSDLSTYLQSGDSNDLMKMLDHLMQDPQWLNALTLLLEHLAKEEFKDLLEQIQSSPAILALLKKILKDPANSITQGTWP